MWPLSQVPSYTQTVWPPSKLRHWTFGEFFGPLGPQQRSGLARTARKDCHRFCSLSYPAEVCDPLPSYHKLFGDQCDKQDLIETIGSLVGSKRKAGCKHLFNFTFRFLAVVISAMSPESSQLLQMMLIPNMVHAIPKHMQLVTKQATPC
jgi:hypothetical protein